MATGVWRQLVRRWWVAALLLILLITIAAFAWNASPAGPHTYTATRTLRITVLPGDDASTYGWSSAQASGETIARDLAGSNLLASQAYAEAVIGQLVGLSPSPTPGTRPSAAAVEHALSARHSAGNVILTASWDSADGASVLADAAIREFATEATASAMPDGASLRLMVEGVGAPAGLDAGAQATRATDILLRGGLAALAVLIVAGALAAAQMMWRQGESLTTTAESARS